MRSLNRLLALCVLSSAVSGAAQAALTITATADVDEARRLELLNIEFIVANSSAFARTGVEIDMVFPVGINSVSEFEFGADCPSTTCDTGETGTWTLGTIPAGGAVMVNVPASVLNAAPDGTIITFAPVVSDDLADSDSDSVDVLVDNSTRYDLALAENADPAMAGSALTYKLSYGVPSDAAVVNNSLLRLVLPASSTFVSASDGGAVNAGSVEWPLGFLSPGDGGIREATITLSGSADAGSVVATTAEIENIADPTERIGSGAATAIAAGTTFGLAIESIINTVRTQENANLQYTVTNTDPFTRFGVTLTGRFAQSFFQVSEFEFDGDCASTTCSNGERIIWTLGDIPAGGSITVDMPPQVNTVALTGTIEPFFAQVTDAAGVSARQMDALRIQRTESIYDLALVENTDPVTASSTLKYKLTFGLRASAGGINNTRLVFPVPDGTTFVSATGGGTLASGVVEWPLGILSPGDSGIREAVFTVDSALATGDIIEAFAELQGITAPAQRARSEANTVVASSVPLEIAIEANPNPARTPERTNFQLTVTNNDPFTRFGVDLFARYPQSTNQVSESEFDGDCASTTCSAGERVTWTLGNIPAGGAVTVDVPIPVVSSATAGELINLFAWAEDDLGEATRQGDTLAITTDTPYDLSLSENSDPATAGSQLTYKLSWGYRSDAAAVAQSTLQFPVPDGATFVSASDGGALNGSTVEWALGFLQPGQGGVRTVTVALGAGLAAGEVIEAFAEVFANATPDFGMRAEADTVVAASVPLGLFIETVPGAARTSERVNQQITVSNNDAFTRFGVVLTARYPEFAIQVFESEFDGDCASTSCSFGERVTWLLGDIPAGGAVSADLPFPVVTGIPDGTLLNVFTKVRDDQGAQALQMDTVREQSDTVYDVALAEDLDPITAGSLITYVVTYGYREDAAAVANSTLRFYVPAGASFVSASGGGVLNGNMVEWPLGFLSPGDGDQRTVTVQAGGGLAAGTVLEATAGIMTTGTGEENARAEADTAIAASVPLSLNIAPNRNNAEASTPVEYLLTVTNSDPFPRFGVELYARFPQGAANLNESVVDFDGDCASSSCTEGERVTWLLGEIAANSSATVLLPPTITIASLVPEGSIVNLFAWARDDQNEQTRDVQSLLIGCLNSIDTDCDGISDLVDNCTTTANFGQQDTDGDLIGNACDPDIAPPVNDCSVNFLDLNAVKVAFFATPVSPNWNPDADFNSDNIVNFTDLNVVKSVFFGQPGPSAAGCN